jgi:3-hydroxyacyl-CoA dehydrogenase/enoyl-CoA hydratase/3-hydroxybutyryl-CoA epimerase
MNFKTITFEIKNKIGYIGFGLYEEKSMTTFTKETLAELHECVKNCHDLEAKNEIQGLIFFSHKPNVFLAGVDISIISSLKSIEDSMNGAQSGQEIFNIVEDLKVPTMALVDGICLGGGCELILSCDRIMVSDNSKTAIGLPEVMLGVLPGFGGTYRMPKRIGLPNALDHILTGKQCRAKKAVKIGLADFMVPKERMLELAPSYLTKKINVKKSFSDSLTEVATDNFLTRKIIFQKAREKVLETTKGFYPAPLKILELLESGSGKKRETYLRMEAQAFGELSQTPQSQSLQHIFFLTDEAKKKKASKEEVKTVEKGAVVGAGTMGGGIAWLFAKNNQAPLMKDINKAGLELGLKQASDNFKGALKRKRMTHAEFERTMRSITPTMKFDQFKNVDIVVEAVVEIMDVKKSVFKELERHVSTDCLITSNTSSLSVTEMATVLETPERFAGLHFFNPVNKMPLVEIIKHDKCDEKTIKSLYNWCLQVKKTPIIVNDGPGFLVNRILSPYLNEVAHLIAEGVSVEDIDKATLNFGMPMGACRLMDEIGIDVCAKVGKIMSDGLGDRVDGSDLSQRMNEAELLGKKNSKGFYTYEEGKSTGVNSTFKSLISNYGSKRLDEVTIQMRTILPMINEAANILEDKIADDAATVDIGMIFGTGFPPFRGGLLRYADNEGLDRILDSIKKFSETVSDKRYKPSTYLINLCEKKKKFYC